MKFIRQLFDIPSLDPDDSRRRKLLNIFLVTSLGISFSVFLFTVYSDILLDVGDSNAAPLYQMSIAFFIGSAIIFFINRYGKGWLASALFLVVLVAAMGFAMPPHILIGSGLFFFTIPILMSSTLLRPWASYLFATLCSAFVTFTELNSRGLFPLPSIAGLFVMAAISWLVARSLEDALQDLRVLNAELDQRVRDRTRELAEANVELSEAYDKLKELDRLKSRFVSMVSHELRTPLNAIQGFVEMMEVGVYGAVTEKHQGALGRIKANTQRLLALVNDLLDQARMEAGRLSLHIAPFSVKGLINDMEATMGVLAEVKGIYLTTRVEAGVPDMLQGDAKRLHQIMLNLINNSIKFTKKGGVDVRVYSPDADHWAFDVADTGPGIPEEAQQYIFEPFRQVDSSITREHTGFGLGLAIVKQLAEAMGGGVNISSELGRGSIFTVILPLHPPQTTKVPHG